MILLADREGPDQTAEVHPDLGFLCPHIHKHTFSHGMAQFMEMPQDQTADVQCSQRLQLTLKVPSKICSRRHSNLFCFVFSEKTSLDISCESSAKQTIHTKSQDLFTLKNKNK